MIQNASHADRTVQGNLTGEEIKMGVADMAHLLNVVTDLYSDREEACIREYSTNAVDAHVEAGVNAPIEVTTPAPLHPFLSIRDFGIGLDLDDIRSIYSQYGASTKRNTNGQTGMLGLGCKSALTYTDQFTVTSVKDGVRIQVVVSRNAQGASMKVVDTSDTDEPNGTTVTIPARANNSFAHKAAKFFSYWRPGTVKLDGKEPEFMPGAKWVSDDIAIVQSEGGYGSVASKIVMGGVPYPAPGLKSPLGYGKGIVAFVGIGAVDFAPSREGLMDTDTTTATLEKVSQKFRTSLMESVRKDVKEAPSHHEAVVRVLEWHQNLPSGLMPDALKYQGKVVPTSTTLPDGSIYARWHDRPLNSHQKVAGLPMRSVTGALWVYGFDYASFTATVKKKLLKYCEDKGITPTGFILVTGQLSTVDRTWLDTIQSVDWPTVKAIKLPRNARNPQNGRIPGSYDVWENGGLVDDTPADDIDTNHDIFWMIGKNWSGRYVAKWLSAKFPNGYTLVMMRDGRQDKFQRLFPKARSATAFVRDEYLAWVKGLDKKVVSAFANQHDGVMDYLRVYDVTKIDDPAIKALPAINTVDTSQLQKDINDWKEVGMYWSTPHSGLTNPFEKYILLPDFYYLKRGRYDMEHVYHYMNSEYARQQGSK
jgi:hypothetical protein